MEGEATSSETPEEFIVALGNLLNEKEDADVGLVDILKAHILKADPAQNAVTQAKDAILKLAGERANSLKPEVAND